VTPLDRLPGRTVLVGADCGVQFAGGRHLILRVIDVTASKSWDGMAWISGYVLDHKGEAVDKRELYVITDGLLVITGLSPVMESACTCPPIKRPFPHRKGCRRAHLTGALSIEDRAAKQRARNIGPVIPRPRTSTETIPGSTR
jgi:hypothetical protein